ncbi:MAG: hypothetical protein R3C46_03640 [Hyphomonadaceae bacterium]
MTTLSPFLRNVIVVDAVTGVVAGLALIAGADVTHDLLGLSSALLFWSGLALIPFVALLAWILRSNATALVPVVIGLNFVWVAASLYVAFGSSFAPTLPGQVFVCAQAAVVFILA